MTNGPVLTRNLLFQTPKRDSGQKYPRPESPFATNPSPPSLAFCYEVNTLIHVTMNSIRIHSNRLLNSLPV